MTLSRVDQVETSDAPNALGNDFEGNLDCPYKIIQVDIEARSPSLGYKDGNGILSIVKGIVVSPNDNFDTSISEKGGDWDKENEWSISTKRTKKFGGKNGIQINAEGENSRGRKIDTVKAKLKSVKEVANVTQPTMHQHVSNGGSSGTDAKVEEECAAKGVRSFVNHWCMWTHFLSTKSRRWVFGHYLKDVY
ncbi:hypothetical protein SUGI_1041770 [Cryptomeria japonica]|nr:hypothetical protein SUGI_1041770 [Cryptomeria japonica]